MEKKRFGAFLKHFSLAQNTLKSYHKWPKSRFNLQGTVIQILTVSILSSLTYSSYNNKEVDISLKRQRNVARSNVWNWQHRIFVMRVFVHQDEQLRECLQGKWSFVENTKTSLYMSSFLAIKPSNGGRVRGENAFILAV